MTKRFHKCPHCEEKSVSIEEGLVERIEELVHLAENVVLALDYCEDDDVPVCLFEAIEALREKLPR